MKPAPHILILYAHPIAHLSRVNRRMAEAAQSLDNVQVHDLYETYPDFYIDVLREQALLEQADMIVFQHPALWYGTPALLKEWMDVVLAPGWAYGGGAQALKGKHFWLAATAGGSEDYDVGNEESDFSVFLPPFRQMARICKMHWLPPLILRGAYRADDALVREHVEAYRQRLASFPHWADQAG
ncbi:NAD(P)H-dependent oxidoreductase [Noviherbaspirillum massiliense]|uniref:glutathione-regulated potassium-efflux system oxidoreductase KefF n=1 Tax=Noviherbaspirillum massiliense TaxID=1465823 RepID=UPI00055884E8|nr:NAD(P)H-dependent oxidoreductase [Noviherbaspirillum massiliense]